MSVTVDIKANINRSVLTAGTSTPLTSACHFLHWILQQVSLDGWVLSTVTGIFSDKQFNAVYKCFLVWRNVGAFGFSASPAPAHQSVCPVQHTTVLKKEGVITQPLSSCVHQLTWYCSPETSPHLSLSLSYSWMPTQASSTDFKENKSCRITMDVIPR